MTTTKNGFTLDDALAFVRNSTKEERASVSNALRSMREDDISEAKAELRIGDTVEFNPNRRGYPHTVRGKVVEKRIKTIIVRPETGPDVGVGFGFRTRDWKITASAVRKVTPTV
jgi:hypothetical protein